MKSSTDHSIDETLQSLDGIHSAEADPMLFERIEARMIRRAGECAHRPMLRPAFGMIAAQSSC